MKIKKPWVSWEEFAQIQGGDWSLSPHTHVKANIIDTPWAWADVLKTGSNLTDLATRLHSSLQSIGSDDHHAQVHTLASHSTKPHSALTGVTSDQHHPQAHTLASHSSKAHSELTEVTADLHHAQNHASRHQLGGADPIKLDDLAEPDNTIDLNSSIARHGLFPKLSNHPAQCLSGTGAWLTLYDSTSIIIQILSKASATTKNSNDTERYGGGGSVWQKVKEVKLGEPTGIMRIYFEMHGETGETVYGRIYKNGVAIGYQWSTPLTTYQQFYDDLGDFAAQDLIQIYIKSATDQVDIRNMRFKYDRSINMLGECSLATPIALTTHDPFSMQNQDP